MSRPNPPLVSVVVTTKNEEANIGNCLSAIRSSDIDGFRLELIVVDNYSTDRTVEIARGFEGVSVYTCGPERNAQRNHGLLDRSTGSYLCWIDADHILHPRLLAECVRYMESHPSTVGLTFPEIILGTSFYSRVRRFERFFYEGTVVDGSRFLRAEAVRKIGGFATDWQHGPDDWDLDLRLKEEGTIDHLRLWTDIPEGFVSDIEGQFRLDVTRYPMGLLHNESRLTIWTHLMKKRHYSTDFMGYVNKYGKDHPAVRKQIGLRYRYLEVFVEDGKWRQIAKNPVLFIAAVSIKVLAGIIYMTYRGDKSGESGC